MTQQDIVERLRANFGKALGEWHEIRSENEYQRRTGSYLEISDPSSLQEIAFFLRDEHDLDFNNLLLISSVDNGDGSLSLAYHLESTRKKHQIAFRITVLADNASVPTITPIWLHANWQEREAWDMIGIRFKGHPDHRRILLDEDYPGYPLRKDFQEPDFFHGMKVPNA